MNEAAASQVSTPSVMAAMVYVPIGPATVKLPVKMPLTILQVGALKTGSTKEQEESVV